MSFLPLHTVNTVTHGCRISAALPQFVLAKLLPQQSVTLTICLAAAPQKESNIKFSYRRSKWSCRLLPTSRQCDFYSRVVLLWGTFLNRLCVWKANISSQKHLIGTTLIITIRKVGINKNENILDVISPFVWTRSLWIHYMWP